MERETLRAATEKIDSPYKRVSQPRLQRASVNTEPVGGVPHIVHDVLNSPGQPLDANTRAYMEPRFGQDFSGVRVHTDSQAAASAQAVNALAYTVGRDVVFGEGNYAPEGHEGRQLLAHELTHVVQQQTLAQGNTTLRMATQTDSTEVAAEQVASTINEPILTTIPSKSTGPTLARAPKSKPTTIGTKYTHPAGVASKYKNVHAEFDGQDFTIFDGKTPIMTHSAQSGKPIAVRPSDATACGGSTSDSYLNNPLYVGIKDFGPIPEGNYTVTLTEFSTFSGWEQAQMIGGGMFTDPFGNSLHGGDWGSGRAPLRPTKILAGKKGCGNTHTRSGFYLHGGSLPGSSGCIDIDNGGVNTFLSLLAGYRKSIPVTVKYTHAAPSVSPAQGAAGRFTYPTDENGKPIKDPNMIDRLKSLIFE